MSVIIKQILQSVAKAAYFVVSRLVGFTLLGGVINIFFILLLLSKTGSALVLPGMVLLLLMPLLYFFLSKKYAISGAVRYLIRENKSYLVIYLIDKVFIYAKKQPGLSKGISAGEAIVQKLPVFLEKLDNMPWVMKLLFKQVIARVDITGLVQEVVGGQKLPELSQLESLPVDSLSGIAAAKANSYLDEKIFAQDLNWLWILIGSNTLLFIIIKVL